MIHKYKVLKYNEQRKFTEETNENYDMKACAKILSNLPLYMEEAESAEELFRNAVKLAEAEGFVKKGDIVVITAGVPLSVAGNTNMIRVIEVE